MKVSLYLAASANGYISKSGSNATISSASGWNRYVKTVKSFGNVILGRKTFQLMEKYGRIRELGNATVVVLSKDVGKKSHFTADSPKAALALMRRLGFNKVLLGGGAKANRAFVEENHIDEVFIDVEPELFADGNRMFADSSIHRRLKLIGIKRHVDGVVQLHYTVVKIAK